MFKSTFFRACAVLGLLMIGVAVLPAVAKHMFGLTPCSNNPDPCAGWSNTGGGPGAAGYQAAIRHRVTAINLGGCARRVAKIAWMPWLKQPYVVALDI